MGGIGLKVPYLRQTPSGFYWEPSRKVRALGFAPEALGKDAAAAVARANELNDKVKSAAAGTYSPSAAAAPGTIARVIQKYRSSKKWQKLQPSTRRGYGQCLDRIERKWGGRHPEAMTRPVVKQWQETLEARAPAFAAAILRVLRIVLKHAKDMGHKVNLEDYAELDLHTAGGNQEPWEDYEISAYLDEAKCQGRQSMALALMLGVCLGQREGDVLALPRSARNPAENVMELRQHKTGRRLAVPILPELQREIDLTPKLGTIFVVSEKSGKPYKEHHFRHVHRAICRAAGIPDTRKFMDLRHTAATRLGDAGCSDELIRSVTGHLDRRVVGRYVKPDSTMAKAAIEKLMAHRRQGQNANLDGNSAAKATETRRKRTGKTPSKSLK